MSSWFRLTAVIFASLLSFNLSVNFASANEDRIEIKTDLDSENLDGGSEAAITNFEGSISNSSFYVVPTAKAGIVDIGAAKNETSISENVGEGSQRLSVGVEYGLTNNIQVGGGIDYNVNDENQKAGIDRWSLGGKLNFDWLGSLWVLSVEGTNAESHGRFDWGAVNASFGFEKSLSSLIWGFELQASTEKRLVFSDTLYLVAHAEFPVVQKATLGGSLGYGLDDYLDLPNDAVESRGDSSLLNIYGTYEVNDSLKVILKLDQETQSRNASGFKNEKSITSNQTSVNIRKVF